MSEPVGYMVMDDFGHRQWVVSLEAAALYMRDWDEKQGFACDAKVYAVVSLELPEPPRSEHAWMRTNEVVEASGGPAPWTCRRCYKAWNSLDDPQADGGACPGAPAVSLELPQSTKEQS